MEGSVCWKLTAQHKMVAQNHLVAHPEKSFVCGANSHRDENDQIGHIISKRNYMHRRVHARPSYLTPADSQGFRISNPLLSEKFLAPDSLCFNLDTGAILPIQCNKLTGNGYICNFWLAL